MRSSDWSSDVCSSDLKGFEIETELTVHALELRMPVRAVVTAYKERPQGSLSQLSTFRDGFRILRAILRLAKEERPLAFFSTGGAARALVSVALAFPLLLTYPKARESGV